MLGLLLSALLAAPAAAGSCPDPECERIGIAEGKDCPCPGPGCPGDGWRSEYLSHPVVGRCMRRAIEARDRMVALCAKHGACREPEDPSEPLFGPIKHDKACPCPGPGCPEGGWLQELDDPAFKRCRSRAQASGRRIRAERERRLEKARRALERESKRPAGS